MALFQSFWTGDSLTPYELMCLRSFADFGHEVHLFSYSENLSVPTGVKLLQACQILPESAYFESPAPSGESSPSAFSDLFRWTLLAQRGGWWIDTDVVCLRGEVPEFELFFATEEAGLIATGVLFAPAGHPLPKRCAEIAANAEHPIRWGSIGPKLATEMVRSLGLDGMTQASKLCYPLHWKEALDVLLPEKTTRVRQRTNGSLFLHLWNQVLRKDDIDKYSLPPEGSFLRYVADQHPVDEWRSELRAEDVRARVELKELQARLQHTEMVSKRQEERHRAQRTDLHTEIRRSTARVKRLERDLRDAKKRISEMTTSSSWQITRPLRAASKFVRLWAFRAKRLF